MQFFGICFLIALAIGCLLTVARDVFREQSPIRHLTIRAGEIVCDSDSDQ